MEGPHADAACQPLRDHSEAALFRHAVDQSGSPAGAACSGTANSTGLLCGPAGPPQTK